MTLVNVKCSLCGADDYEVIYESTIGDACPTAEECTSTVSGYARSNRIVRCRSCGFMYANPRDEGLTGLYEQVVDNDYLESWNERARTFRGHLRVLKRVREEIASLDKRRQYPPRNDAAALLDIGCYAGIFLDEAKKAGYSVMGIEPSKWAADYARNKTGAKVIQGGWNKASLPEGQFDVVTMWDVIEHVDDPSACLKQAHRWLKPGGIAALTTHDINSLFARIMGKRYPWLMRFHLYHFSPKTISAMLAKNGFETVLVKYYVKSFSLKYILGRLGLGRDVEKGTVPTSMDSTVRGQSLLLKLFEKMNVPLPSGDMFMVVARKKVRE
jgi:2-polyprenyl-3-methyl-5-hydroxy-6-metoxy-1,4-benzoquinol methylase